MAIAERFAVEMSTDVHVLMTCMYVSHQDSNPNGGVCIRYIST